ncbi:MAG: hypothetical protein R6X33_18340 [Candidatus Brocadiia bacterium]
MMRHTAVGPALPAVTAFAIFEMPARSGWHVALEMCCALQV